MSLGDLGGLLTGSSTQTQTTTAKPSTEQQQLINAGLPFAQQFAGQGGVHMSSTAPIAGFDPAQLTGQAMALGAVPTQQGVVGSAAQGNQFLSSGAALDPASNPSLAATIRAAMTPLEQNFNENVLPGIRGAAVGAGGYGGSREGIAEGIASRGLEQAEGTAATNIAYQNYQDALNAMTKAQATSPEVAAEQTLPGQTYSGVGDVRQALQNALLGYGFTSDMFNQMSPLTTAEALLPLSAQIPGGTTTSTGTGTNTMSPMQAAIGLLAAGTGGYKALTGKA
jgi:hypothetical protein